MKHLILLVCAALGLHASSMDLRSGVSAGGSNNLGSNMVINPYPDWAVDAFANWISFGNTGFGGIVTPNATDMSSPTATFYQDFELADGTGVEGSLHIWADDYATVRLDGVVLFSANTTLGPLCAAGPIGCTQANGGTIEFYAVGLSHRLEFDVYQGGLATFGLMYEGHLESTVGEVPEPASILIVGLGLVALGLASRSRRNGVTSLTR